MNDERRPIKQILFVCMGNTCRSPMAEALFNMLAVKNGLDIKSGSAGVMAMQGQRAARNAIYLMAKRGIDLDDHKARQLDSELSKDVDLILTMDSSHLLSIPKKYQDNAYLLSEYASGERLDIFDPVGSDLETYRACAILIEGHLNNLISKLKDR